MEEKIDSNENVSLINIESPLKIPLEDGCTLVLPTFKDILNMDIHVEWVVEGIIPKLAITTVHGKGGIRKTWLMLQMGSRIADGKPFLGLATVKMPCYYVDFENPLTVLHDRASILGGSDLRIWHLSNKILPLYSVKEVAEVLHLSVYRVGQHIRAGRLKAHVHMGRCNTKRLYVVEQDLRVFIFTHFLEDYWPGLKRPKIPLSNMTG